MHMGVLTPFSPSISPHRFQFCLLTWKKKMFPLFKCLLALFNPVSFSSTSAEGLLLHFSWVQLRSDRQYALPWGDKRWLPTRFFWGGCPPFPSLPHLSEPLAPTECWRRRRAPGNQTWLMEQGVIKANCHYYSVCLPFSCYLIFMQKKTNKRWFISVSVM